MPGSMPATSQLDWLSSMTAMIVLFWSRATRDLLKSFGWGIAALHRENAATKLPFPRRPPHSVFRSRSCERLFWALPIGDGSTKGGATYRFRSETAMLAWSGCPQPFPSRRDREFESVFHQQRVRRNRWLGNACGAGTMLHGAPTVHLGSALAKAGRFRC